MTGRRTSRVEQVICRNRATRLAFVALVFPITWAADRLHLDRRPPASLRTTLRWAWTGRAEHIPTIRTAAKPAVVGRRHRSTR
jgi:hypothetical protein